MVGEVDVVFQYQALLYPRLTIFIGVECYGTFKTRYSHYRWLVNVTLAAELLLRNYCAYKNKSTELVRLFFSKIRMKWD